MEHAFFSVERQASSLLFHSFESKWIEQGQHSGATEKIHLYETPSWPFMKDVYIMP